MQTTHARASLQRYAQPNILRSASLGFVIWLLVVSSASAEDAFDELSYSTFVMPADLSMMYVAELPDEVAEMAPAIEDFSKPYVILHDADASWSVVQPSFIVRRLENNEKYLVPGLRLKLDTIIKKDVPVEFFIYGTGTTLETVEGLGGLSLAF